MSNIIEEKGMTALLESLLEKTRQEIAEQLSLVGKSIQSIDPTLLEMERELEQAVIDAHLDAPAAPAVSKTKQEAILHLQIEDSNNVELLTPPVTRFFRDGVEHTLIQATPDDNEDISEWMHTGKGTSPTGEPIPPIDTPDFDLADLIAPHEGDKE